MTKRSIVKDKERFEKRILEELSKIFTETDSFFFCRTGDITNSLQRQCVAESQQDQSDQNKPLWQRVDDRFFWNKHMLHDIINLNVSNFYKLCICSITSHVVIERNRETPHNLLYRSNLFFLFTHWYVSSEAANCAIMIINDHMTLTFCVTCTTHLATIYFADR